MPPHGRVGCCWGITALREHACTQDAKAHNRYATNYIRLPSVSKQSPLPLSFYLFCFFTLTSSSFWSSTWNSKKLPNQIRKKSWQSEWTFLLPPIFNRISDVSFTQHFRTTSLHWAQDHIIVFPLIYGFQGNLSTLRHCNIQREYQNLNKNPLPSPSPPPPRYPVNKCPWDSSTRDQNPQQSSTDRQTVQNQKGRREQSPEHPPAHRRTELFSQTKYKRFPQNKNVLACCDFLLLRRAIFYYSPAMQLRPPRQQLLQNHATTKISPTRAPPPPFPHVRISTTEDDDRNWT
jgi:hypothetical protein